MELIHQWLLTRNASPSACRDFEPSAKSTLFARHWRSPKNCGNALKISAKTSARTKVRKALRHHEFSHILVVNLEFCTFVRRGSTRANSPTTSLPLWDDAAVRFQKQKKGRVLVGCVPLMLYDAPILGPSAGLKTRLKNPFAAAPPNHGLPAGRCLASELCTAFHTP
jgi:hypothetical protein